MVNKKTKKPQRPFEKWLKKINWTKRAKAICKPCWEIKYCPYGPLVEDFPLKREPDEKSCRIFGHDCPVFYVAEPFTETKELRNISRTIPRVTQFRVLKRENQICASCGNSVKDEDVEFDHIIPWSKGGPSDEHNVRLLCRMCNKKRGNKFENQYLVASVTDHLNDPVGIEFLGFLLLALEFAQSCYEDNRQFPTAKQFADFFTGGKVSVVEERAAEYVIDLRDFFRGNKPHEIKQRVFKALAYRWGFIDRVVHKLLDSALKYGVDIEELFIAELSLISRLGWTVKLTASAQQKWKSK